MGATLRQTLSVLLNLRPGDGWPLLILLLHSFLKGAARVLLETPTNSLFLSRFSIDKLPLVYLATALVCTLIGLVYARLEARISVKALLTATLGFLCIVTLAFYIGLSSTNSKTLIFGVMVWKDVHWTLMNLEFWALAGLLLDVRQGKRLFGMIALGEIIAGTLGGFSVPLFMKTGSTQGLILVSAVVTIVNVFLLIQTLRRFSGQGASSHEEKEEKRKPWWTLFQDRYLALFFGVSVLSFFGEYFIDYLFYEGVERTFSDEAKLASFFGLFYGVLGLGQLISSAWVSGRCLTRYGLSFGLLALPAAALVNTGVASVGGLVGAAVVVLFWAIVSAKFFDETIRHTIEMPAYRILYQPLPAHQRLRVQTIRESIIEPLSIGLVGVILWAIQSLVALKPLHILYLTFTVALAWAGLCVLLRREYTLRLTRALTTRRLGGGSLSLEDQSSISVLEQGFASGKSGQVIYCLNMLEEAQHPSLESHLLKLLDHPDPLVRSHVLGKVERLTLRHALEPVTQRLPLESAPGVKAAMLRTICALGEANVLEQIIPHLKDPEPTIRRGALVGLLRYCGIDGVLAGGSHLNGLLTSDHPPQRQLAAQVLGEIGIVSFYRPLLALLRDENDAVRIAAMDAARNLHAVGVIPAVLAALKVPALRTVASATLVELGDAAVPYLEKYFAQSECSHECRRSISAICGRIGSENAAAFLTRQLAFPDGSVREQVLSALVRCREKLGGPELPEARTMIAAEVKEAAWALAAWADLEGDAALPELSGALLGEIEARKQRAFLLLALIYPPPVIRKAQLDLEIIGGERKANALEVLDNLLGQELKKLIFPLIDTLSPSERGKSLWALFLQPQLGRQARLVDILTQPAGKLGSWTMASALYGVGKSAAVEWSPVAVAACSDPAEVVRETALWTLRCVNPAAFRERVAAGETDPGTALLYRKLMKKEGSHAPHH